MVLKLYGFDLSSNLQRVAIVLFEKKIPFEYHAVDWTKYEHKSPEYLEKHPFGQVPYLDDDAFVVYECRAICRYLEAKYPDQGPKLAPDSSDIKAKAIFDQAASVEVSNFGPLVDEANFEAIVKPMLFKQPKNEANYNEAIKALDAKLDGYERILAKQKYLAGNELTMIDLFHLPSGARLALGGSDILTSKGPNIARWWKDISSRESWAQVQKGTAPGLVKFD
ncbi:hypothetical protein D9758_013044 [Tetrapyrgos nigripes]|uniref:glutathione transferase n=1 Tax=Tetrapyrgos nigripes TaxID=182062 RepID=A0A8H5FQB7_9AGAR|nr:hypothetical protein D9758_013044 [Tetrapyrgos nigripes]